MKTLKYILFFVVSVLALQSCNNDDENQSFFAEDELPRIFMEQWSATQAVELGSVVKWAPEVSPSDGATFKWTLNGEVVSSEKNLEYTVSKEGEYELKFEVTRNGVSNTRTAALLVTKPFVPKEYNKKSIAYIDAFEGNVANIDWNTVTHVVISSALVNANGVNLEFKSSTLDIDNLVAVAHNYGVYVLLQISGDHSKLNGLPVYGSYDFYNLAIDATKRDLLIQTVFEYAKEKKLDGIDIYFDKAHDGAFPQPKLVKEFYQAFADAAPLKSEIGQNFLLTASVVVGWTRTSNADLANIGRYNWITFLAFAQEDLTPTAHSSAWSCSDNAAFWTGAGLDPEKVIVGCPAFSITYDLKGNTPTWGNLWEFTSYTPYSELLKTYPDAYNKNSISVADGIFYDGFSALQEKADMVKAQNYGGMALWKVNYDLKDTSKSLMYKINSALGN